MAEIFEADGEDAGSTPWEFDSVDTYFSLQAAAAIHGSYGYQITSPGGSGWAGAGFKTFGASQAEVYARYYLNCGSSLYKTAGGTQDWPILMIRDTLTSIIISVGLKWSDAGNPDGWYYYDKDSNIERITTGFSMNADHYLELHAQVGSPGVCAWRVDGQLINTYTPNISNNLNDIVFGKWSPMGVSIDLDEVLYLDDLLLDTTGWIGGISEEGGGEGGDEAIRRGGLIEPTWFDLMRYGRKRR